VREYKEVRVKTQHIASITCDACKKEVDVNEDPMEAQEFVHIDHECGYSSGDDGTHWQVDFCYECAKRILGPFWRDVTQ
jgi:hypothetical protein